MTHVALVLLFVVFAALPLLSQEGNRSANGWWSRSAVIHDTVQNGLKLGIEGGYGFSMTSGNSQGHTHNGSGLLALRYGRTTLMSTARINAIKTNLGSGIQELDQMVWLAGASIGVDVSESIRPEIGIYAEGDNTGFLRNRQTAYAGATFILPLDSTFFLTLLPAVGVQDETADITYEERTINTLYFELGAKWNVTPRLSIQETFRYWQDVRMVFGGGSDIYRMQSMTVVSTPVFSFIDLQILGTIAYNNHPIPTAAILEETLRSIGLKGTIQKMDTYLGFRINVHVNALFDA